MSRTELLAPAGNLNNLRYALAYGADAVYAGMPRYSLRVRNNDFNRIETLAAGIDAVHASGKAFFLASNVLPHNSKVRTFLADMEPVMELGPDALIMADPGLILLVLVLTKGEVGQGARRWLDLGIRFQPSEAMKLGVLDTIPGLGPVKRSALLGYFGSCVGGTA